MIRALSTETYFTPEQVSFRNSIGERLSAGLTSPGAIQLLLVNFIYSPPGLLTIANADSQLPEWLLQDYKDIYEQNSSRVSAQSTSQSHLTEPRADVPKPDFGVFLKHCTS